MKDSKEILEIIFSQGIVEKGRAYLVLFEKWENIVGPELFQNSKIADIKHGKVLIHVNHPAISQLIYLRKESIIKKMNQILKSKMIKSIYVSYNDKLEIDNSEENDLADEKHKFSEDEFYENDEAAKKFHERLEKFRKIRAEENESVD